MNNLLPRTRRSSSELPGWPAVPGTGPQFGEFVQLKYANGQGTGYSYGVVVAVKDHLGKLIITAAQRQELAAGMGSKIAVRWLLGPDDTEKRRSFVRRGFRQDAYGVDRYTLSGDWYNVVPVDCIVAAVSCLLKVDTKETLACKFPVFVLPD